MKSILLFCAALASTPLFAQSPKKLL